MELMNCKMFDVLKGQFKSNLIQDLLALSAFYQSEPEWRGMVSECLDLVVKKIENENTEKGN